MNLRIFDAQYDFDPPTSMIAFICMERTGALWMYAAERISQIFVNKRIETDAVFVPKEETHLKSIRDFAPPSSLEENN